MVMFMVNFNYFATKSGRSHLVSRPAICRSVV